MTGSGSPLKTANAIVRLSVAHAELIMARHVESSRGWMSDTLARIDAEKELEAAREELDKCLQG